MTILDFKNKTICLYGKSRALSAAEFLDQLKVHEITLLKTVVSSESSVDYAIEGRMVNPIEQMELDRIYEEDVCSIVDLNVLEKVLCDSIDENKLLMSLKLSGDEDRLFGFLKNKLVPNALFLKLLKLYNWQG